MSMLVGTRCAILSGMSGNEESAAQDQPARCWLVSFSTLAGATYKEAAAANLSTPQQLQTELGH
jgi:hypothetical protein